MIIIEIALLTLILSVLMLIFLLMNSTNNANQSFQKELISVLLSTKGYISNVDCNTDQTHSRVSDLYQKLECVDDLGLKKLVERLDTIQSTNSNLSDSFKGMGNTLSSLQRSVDIIAAHPAFDTSIFPAGTSLPHPNPADLAESVSLRGPS